MKVASTLFIIPIYDLYFNNLVSNYMFREWLSKVSPLKWFNIMAWVNASLNEIDELNISQNKMYSDSIWINDGNYAERIVLWSVIDKT